MSGFCSGRNYFETVFLPYLEQRFDDSCDIEDYDVDWFLSCLQKDIYARLEQVHVNVPLKTVNQWDYLRKVAWTISGQTPVEHVVNQASIETYKRSIKQVLKLYSKQLQSFMYSEKTINKAFRLPNELCVLGISEFILEILDDLENDEIQASRSTPYVVKFNESSKSLNVDGNSIPLNDMEALFTKAILIDKIHNTTKIAIKLDTDNDMVRQIALKINNKVRLCLSSQRIKFFNGSKPSVGYVLTDAFKYQP